MCKKGTMEKIKDIIEQDSVEFEAYKCTSCGEEIVDMEQLHEVAETYRNLKKYHVKLSKWGLSLGLRIPKDLVKKYNLKSDNEVSIIPEKRGIKIIT